MNIDDICFAVTNQYIIIPLMVTNRVSIDDAENGEEELTQVETTILGESTIHMKGQHKTYFRIMWLGDDGRPDMCNVFLNKGEAVEYAVERATVDSRSKLKEVVRLENQIEELRNYY